jgi:hypothetical protein
MRNIVYYGLATAFVLVSMACDKKDPLVSPAAGDLEYFVFGHFYGECGGEACIEIYKMDAISLWEDTTDVYPTWMSPYIGTYIALPNEKFELVKDIIDFFPEALYSEANNFIGIPDGGDWGGIYVEIRYVDDEEKSGFWLLDQNAYNMPDVYNAFVERINEKITLINQ